MNLPQLKFDEKGLIAAIIQDAESGQVLQLGWMNELALRTTIEKRLVTFWSRSRNELWTKGETSGNTLELVSIEYDCDEDALLVKAHLNGVGVCHTGARSDWFRTLPTRDVTLPDGSHADYPLARASDHVDVLHDVGVPDPYRWLEDLDSDETKQWVSQEVELTERYLSQTPQRDAIRARLTELWDYEKVSPPFKRGDRLFHTRNDGLQNQSVVMVAESADDAPRVLLDPNRWSEDGTVALTLMSPSRDGSLIAYGVSSGGSDWLELKVADVATGQDADDHLKFIKFSGLSWTPDRAGFYYSGYDEATEGLQSVNYFHKLRYHRIGTPQSSDDVAYERPDQKEWLIHGSVTEDGRFLIIDVSRGTDPKNCLFYRDLSDPASDVVELLPDFEASFSYLANDGTVLYVATDLDAPLRRVVAIDLADPARDRWRDVIPEADDSLEGVGVVGDKIFATYLRDASSRVLVYRLDGTLEQELDLPGLGTVAGFGGRRVDTETYYTFTNSIDPGTIYRYELATGGSSVWRRPEVKFDPLDFTTERVFYESADGTRVPMFLAYRNGTELAGANPTYLYSYGGFRISMSPVFSIPFFRWIESGGVLAVPCIRGGGEYGEQWHLAGTKERKQNVFDDFIAAAEWLIENDWTSPEHLGIGGGSNGGLLVGACETQRPDLFGAVHAAVGVMDMLRFTKFTIGWAWTSDYGDPDDPDDFRVLLDYSPLHNIEPGTHYPPTIVVTADHDDRVWPGHSFKFAATMQAAQGGDAPVLARIETRAGHGAGKPTAKQIEEAADVWSFLDWHLAR